MTHDTSSPLYSRVVALDRQVHARLRLKPAMDLAFAAGISAVPLLSAEFREAAREYAIVFVRGTDQRVLPAVLTGQPDGPNVYLDAAGRWNAQYVPAYVRRYPFLTAQTAPDQFTVCIDAACSGFDTTEGAQLFAAEGEPSPLLEQVVQNLADYQRHAQLTEAFVQRLIAAGILVDADAKADLANGQAMALRGFCVVDETRLRALPESTLKEWLASGELGLIYAHLLSLGNLLQLLRRQPLDETLSSDVPKSIQ